MAGLESRLKYYFRNPKLLSQALSHASLRYETKRDIPDNQRLEFLGDAVLQLVLSEALFQRLPSSDEGALTKRRIRLVSEKALAALARKIELGHEMLLGRAEEAQGGRSRDSILADTMEAVIGAVYLDGGIEGARTFLLGLVEEEIQEALANPDAGNPKGDLQELLQAFGTPPPAYTTLNVEGPDHQKLFQVVVSLEDKTLGEGKGRSKKDAEIEAAKNALDSESLKSLLATLKKAAAAATGR